MNIKEAREIILGMELSAETLLKAEKILSTYTENEEIPEEVINTILLIVDKDIDVNKIVEEDTNSVL
jgi:predicted ATPase